MADDDAFYDVAADGGDGVGSAESATEPGESVHKSSFGSCMLDLAEALSTASDSSCPVLDGQEPAPASSASDNSTLSDDGFDDFQTAGPADQYAGMSADALRAEIERLAREYVASEAPFLLGAMDADDSVATTPALEDVLSALRDDAAAVLLRHPRATP